jgi:Spy/CpxP family protein refolding chaperone
MEETRLSIEKVLTPEQVQRFRERHRRHLEDERL